MKVIIADKMDHGAQTVLNYLDIEVDARPSQGEIALDAVISQADALLVRSATTVDADLIARAPKLKAIGRAGIGVDNIDISAASDAGVLVMNTPLANAVSTAEHAIGLMFAIARFIPMANAKTHAGIWDKNSFKGREISHKNLGIIGCGNIGRVVANRAQGLHMRVLVFDPMLSEADADKLGVEKVRLSELLSRADFITLHTPLTKETRGMLGEAEMALMKPTACIINAARGGLIDELALQAALDKGQLAGAALDVYADEPLQNSPLCNHPKIVMTPHIAASTYEAQANVALQIAEQVGKYLKTGEITHALNTVDSGRQA